MWTSGARGAKCLLVLMTLIALCWFATLKLKSAGGKLLPTRFLTAVGNAKRACSRLVRSGWYPARDLNFSKHSFLLRNMMNKFVSRKLILTLVVVAIVAGSDMLGLDLSDETLSSLTTMVLSFVGAQGLVDVSEVIQSGRKVAAAIEDVKEVADEPEES